MENAAVHEKLIHMVKNSNVTKVRNCEHKQRSVLEQTSLQRNHIRTFSDGFQIFFCTPASLFIQGPFEVLEECLISNKERHFESSLLRYSFPLYAMKC